MGQRTVGKALQQHAMVGFSRMSSFAKLGRRFPHLQFATVQPSKEAYVDERLEEGTLKVVKLKDDQWNVIWLPLSEGGLAFSISWQCTQNRPKQTRS